MSSDESAYSEGEASIYSIQLKGINKGGAIGCQKCPSGFVSSST